RGGEVPGRAGLPRKVRRRVRCHRRLPSRGREASAATVTAAAVTEPEARRAMSVPPRLFVVLAREAPIGDIRRRGPAPWYHVILWHTDTDAFDHGAWFKGRIYEERCALAP